MNGGKHSVYAMMIILSNLAEIFVCIKHAVGSKRGENVRNQSNHAHDSIFFFFHSKLYHTPYSGGHQEL